MRKHFNFLLWILLRYCTHNYIVAKRNKQINGTGYIPLEGDFKVYVKILMLNKGSVSPQKIFGKFAI